MRNFKDLLSEVAQPKSPDEQRFVDQHKIEFWDHPVAFDHQFSGNIQKDTSRAADYQPGDDEQAYDQAYAKDTDMTEDANIHKDIKELPAAEFKKKYRSTKTSMLSHLRNRKTNPRTFGSGPIRTYEGVNLQEISKDLLKRAAAKADSNAASHYAKSREADKAATTADQKKPGSGAELRKSADKHYSAGNKNTKRGFKFSAAQYKEETESTGVNLQELSRIVLENYINQDITEAFTPGSLTLADNRKIVVKESEATLLNDLFETLDKTRRTKMEEHARSSQRNFKAVLEFAATALGKK